jgi:hypothetical protein
MSSRNRSFNRRPASLCPLEIQSLETRQLLAAAILDKDPDAQIVIMPYNAPVVDGGTVSITTSRAGDITLIGDDKPNQVSVEIRGTTLLIDGNAATQFRLPGQTPQPVLEIPLPATVRSITVSLSSGSDNLTLRVFSDVTVNRDVAVSLGAGEDSLTLQVTSADLKVNQNITVDLGAGNDSAHAYTSDAASIVAGRDITIRAAAGGDSLLVGDGDFVDLDNLYSVEYFQGLENNSEITRNQRILATRDFNVDLGAGNDRLSLSASLPQVAQTLLSPATSAPVAMPPLPMPNPQHSRTSPLSTFSASAAQQRPTKSASMPSTSAGWKRISEPEMISSASANPSASKWPAPSMAAPAPTLSTRAKHSPKSPSDAPPRPSHHNSRSNC